MECPYNRKRLAYTRQVKNNLVSEDTGVISGYTECVVEEYGLMECTQENCGAWLDGKCNYNQGVNG